MSSLVIWRPPFPSTSLDIDMGCTRNDHLFLLRRDLSLIDQRERDPLQKLWRTIFVLTMAVHSIRVTFDHA